MATSLFMLLDDIATMLDDVAMLTKVAARKTAGVLGDDLALNAQQVSGVAAERELPVVWAVAKGSFVNKLILVPLALLISAVAPWAVLPLLMIGGAYLCFEGVEKLAHKWLHREDDAARQAQIAAVLADPNQDLAAYEQDKIKGAIRTDFILSAEIVTIALGTVAAQPLATRVGVLAVVAVAMTVGVYGLVAAIVKLDDAGFALLKSPRAALRGLGHGLLALAPKLMRFLAIAGTAAMFLVGGGIVVHGWPWLHHLVEPWMAAGGWPAEMGINLVVGVVVGAVVLAGVEGVQRLRGAG